MWLPWGRTNSQCRDRTLSRPRKPSKVLERWVSASPDPKAALSLKQATKQSPRWIGTELAGGQKPASGCSMAEEETRIDRGASRHTGKERVGG